MANSIPQSLSLVLSLQTLTLFLLLSLSNSPLPAQAQSSSNTPSCISKLTSCALYLDSPSPPANCCTPLKEAVTNDLSCLCDVYEDPSLLKSLGINLTQALKLPQNCGIVSNSTTDNLCKALPPSGTITNPPPPPHTGTASKKRVRIGVSGFVTFLTLWSIWI